MTQLYLAERFWPKAGALAELEAAAGRLRAAAGRGDGGEQVRYLGSVLVPGDEVVFCLFEAADMEAVLALNERAEVGLDRVVGCRGVAGDSISIPRTAGVEVDQGR